MVDFVLQAIPEESGENVLDIGCATGLLSQAIADRCSQVLGIDLDTDMIRRANEDNAYEHVTYLEMNMLNMDHILKKETMDKVICFGNTLVHLTDQEDIFSALKNITYVLKKDGKLMIQILNYHYILDTNMKALPLIDNEHIKFERFYSEQVRDERLIFETRLTVKDTGNVISNEIYLYPLLKNQLEKMLLELGYMSIHFYCNFKRKPYHYEHLPLIVEAIRH